MSEGRKPLYFHPSCKKDYLDLPESVQDDAGHNLDRVQQGLQPQISFDALRGFGSGVMELRIPEGRRCLPGRVRGEVFGGRVRAGCLQEEVAPRLEAPPEHRGPDSPAVRGRQAHERTAQDEEGKNMEDKTSSEREMTFDGPYESPFDLYNDPDRAGNLKVRSKLMNLPGRLHRPQGVYPGRGRRALRRLSGADQRAAERPHQQVHD